MTLVRADLICQYTSKRGNVESVYYGTLAHQILKSCSEGPCNVAFFQINDQGSYLIDECYVGVSFDSEDLALTVIA